MPMLRHRTLRIGSSVCVPVCVVVCVEVVNVTFGRVVGRSVTGTTETGTVGIVGNGGSVGIRASLNAAPVVVVMVVDLGIVVVVVDIVVVASRVEVVSVVGAVVVAVDVVSWVLLVVLLVLVSVMVVVKGTVVVLLLLLLLLLLLVLLEELVLVFVLGCAFAEPTLLEVENPSVASGKPIAGAVWVTGNFGTNETEVETVVIG